MNKTHLRVNVHDSYTEKILHMLCSSAKCYKHTISLHVKALQHGINNCDSQE